MANLGLSSIAGRHAVQIVGPPSGSVSQVCPKCGYAWSEDVIDPEPGLSLTPWGWDCSCGRSRRRRYKTPPLAEHAGRVHAQQASRNDVSDNPKSPGCSGAGSA